MLDGLVENIHVVLVASTSWLRLCSPNEGRGSRDSEDECNEEDNESGDLEGSHDCEVVTTVEWLETVDGDDSTCPGEWSLYIP